MKKQFPGNCEHIKSSNFEKIKIKYICHTSYKLAYSIAVALNTYIQAEKLPKEARLTITKFNNLFDVLNSSKQYCIANVTQELISKLPF